MYNLNNVKTLCDDAFLAVGEKGVDVAGMPRSQLPAAIRAIELNDYTDINQSLSNILGEPVTDVAAALVKLTALKEEERRAIVAKGTLVLPSEKWDQYAQKIRAIRSYSDLTFSGVMPAFILDPEPTGSTVVYMRPGATGDGSDWSNAMSDFTAAHALLTGSKNVIYMEEGVYQVTGEVTLKNNIKIYGGFQADNHAWSSRNSFNYRTVLDAQLTNFRLIGNTSNTTLLDGLSIINTRNTANSPFTNCYYCKNLIAQDCQNTGGNGGGFTACNSSANLIAINCQASAAGGGFQNCSYMNSCIAVNCSASTYGGGFNTVSNSNNLFALNCKVTSGSGGGFTTATNCHSIKIVNCQASNQGSASYGDGNNINVLILNCYSSGGAVLYLPNNCQNYTVANCIANTVFYLPGSASLTTAAKIYNCVCFNNKNTSGTLCGFYLATANYYYKLYNCRADAAISFATNAATYADIQNFSLIQNNNLNTKFADTGTFPTVGNLPCENNVINQKYIDGDYGNFNIPSDSVLAGAGYWEDGFSFGWDIDGKPRNATHCSIGCYEPNWA